MRNRTTVKPKPGLFLQPFVISQLSGQLLETVVEGTGLATREFAVTSWLAIVQPVTPTRLAQDLGLSPTTLSAMIERLVRKKQIRRVRNADDGRSYLLELTARGQTTNAGVRRRFERALASVRERVDGDPDEILEAMRLLEDALRRTLADA